MKIRVIIRDARGETLACLCSNIDHLMKSIVGEALALRIAIVLCLELGLSSVVLEGDSQMVVKATSNEEMLTDNGT